MTVRWSRAWATFRRLWPTLKYFVGLGLAALAFWALTGRRSELSGAAAYLDHLHWGWVAVGVGFEAGSLVAFAGLQRRLLRAGRVDVGFGPMTAITLVSTTITNSIPAGPVVATIFTFGQFRRRGADDALAGWALVATFVAASVSLALLAAVGVAVAGAEGVSLDLVTVIVVVLVVTLAMGVVFVQKRMLVWLVSQTVRVSRRLFRHPRGELGSSVDRIIRRLTVVTLTPSGGLAATGWGLANWVLDCGCLVLSFMAVGVDVPWKGLLLAYGAGQLAANLPITPGGLGVVEGSLQIALVAFGGNTTSTVAAVLLYRILSFWLELPFGWATWGVMAWTGRRQRPGARSAAAAGVEGGVDGLEEARAR